MEGRELEVHALDLQWDGRVGGHIDRKREMQLILQRWIRGYLCRTENDVRAFDSAKSHFAVPRVDDAWR